MSSWPLEFDHRDRRSDQGMSYFSFERHFPNERNCFEHLFWARGGQAIRCPKCGRHNHWRFAPHLKQYRCKCQQSLPLRTGTPFAASNLDLWRSYCGLVLFLNFGRPPPGQLLCRHLDLSASGAWHFVRRLRGHLNAMKAAVLEQMRSAANVVIDLHFYRHVSTNPSRGAGQMAVLHISDGKDCLSFPLQSPEKKTVRDFLRGLFPEAQLWCAPKTYFSRADRLAFHSASLLESHTEALAQTAARLMSHGLYCRRSIRKGPKHLSRSYIGLYLAELDFRFAYANDKRLMFPEFFRGMGSVKWPR